MVKTFRRLHLEPMGSHILNKKMFLKLKVRKIITITTIMIISRKKSKISIMTVFS